VDEKRAGWPTEQRRRGRQRGCARLRRSFGTVLGSVQPAAAKPGTWQVHPGADEPGQDLVGQGGLWRGGEALPQVGRVLQRARAVAAQRGAHALHAGDQVQGGGRLLRAHRQKELQQGAPVASRGVTWSSQPHAGAGHQRHRAGQPVRLLHHDQPERGGRGADAQGGEGGGARGVRRPRQEALPPLHHQPRHRVLF